MVIRSVMAGSVVVELGFLRANGTPTSLADNSDIGLRLKSAALAGELDKLGIISINFGSTNLFQIMPPPRKIVSASVGMFTNNALVYYKPHTVSSGGGTVRNHRSVSRRT